MNKLFIIIPVFVLLLVACSNQKEMDTATQGNVKIAVDESFKAILKEEKEVFQYLYKYAKVSDIVVPQETAHQLLIRDSVKLILSSRPLNSDEIKYLKSNNVYPKIYEFAEDGLTFILNKNNQDSSIALTDVKAFLKRSDNILVVDNSNGASFVSFVTYFNLQKDTLKNVFSAGSTEKVIDYVAEHQNAIGIISSSWISDQENPKVQKLRARIRIAKVSEKRNSISYYPFQSEIADSIYPLIRKVYIISRESKMGIANGFAAFLLGEKGQRIVLKAGLMPSRMPTREIVISKKDIR